MIVYLMYVLFHPEAFISYIQHHKDHIILAGLLTMGLLMGAINFFAFRTEKRKDKSDE